MAGLRQAAAIGSFAVISDFLIKLNTLTDSSLDKMFLWDVIDAILNSSRYDNQKSVIISRILGDPTFGRVSKEDKGALLVHSLRKAAEKGLVLVYKCLFYNLEIVDSRIFESFLTTQDHVRDREIRELVFVEKLKHQRKVLPLLLELAKSTYSRSKLFLLILDEFVRNLIIQTLKNADTFEDIPNGNNPLEYARELSVHMIRNMRNFNDKVIWENVRWHLNKELNDITDKSR